MHSAATDIEEALQLALYLTISIALRQYVSKDMTAQQKTTNLTSRDW
jgi:hypothetical protein